MTIDNKLYCNGFKIWKLKKKILTSYICFFFVDNSIYSNSFFLLNFVWFKFLNDPLYKIPRAITAWKNLHVKFTAPNKINKNQSKTSPSKANTRILRKHSSIK